MKMLIALVSSCLWLVATPALAADTIAPQLSSIGISPDPVDVSVAAQPLTLTLAITDDESGLANAYLYFYNQAGHYIKSGSITAAERISGTPLSGVYSVNVTVPLYSAPGTWRVDVYLSDGVGNSRSYGGGFGGNPFPVPADANFTVANTGQIDAAAPVVATSAVAPTTVNTGTVAQTITVDFTVTDDLAGLNYGWVYVWRPDGVFRNDLLQFFSGGSPLSGNKMAGTYQVSIPLPRNSPQGAWTMQIYATDETGNYFFTPIGGFTVGNTSESIGTLASALDAIQLPWTSSTPGWSHQKAVSHDGIDAAASDPLGDSGEATLQTTVTGPGVLSFQWRVDSEAAADVLSVEVTGTAIHQEISGNTAWAPVSLTIPAGSHTIGWKYAKNAAVAVGADRGWIDEVRFVAAVDAELPTLQALRITPNPVNLGIGPQVVTFALEITDDCNGFSDGYVNLHTPSGTWYDSVPISAGDRVSGNALAGTYEVTYEIPQGVDYGDWRVAVELIEAVTNSSRNFGEGNEPFAELGEGLFTVWDGVSTDNLAPLIEEFTIDPIEVDISSAAATVAVTVRITDSQEGFRDGVIDVYTPSGDWTGSVFFNDSTRTMGDSFDGTYQITVPVPLYGPPGTWRLQCSVSDVASNRRDYPFGSPFPPGADGTFTVVNNGDVDLLAPVVTSIRISPGLVDTRTASATIRVTLSISDDLGGLRDAQLYFYDPLDHNVGGLFAVLDGSNRISGDTLSATHQVDFTIPQGAAMGTWTIRTYLRDTIGRTNFYGLDGTAYPEPGDGEFTVWDGVSADEEAPRIEELTITPATVDLTGAGATVIVTARITDAQAGFSGGNFDVITPAGDWTGSTVFSGNNNRVSGNEFDGVYQITLPVPRYGPPGTWRVTCYLADGAGNGRAYPSGTAFPAAAHETFTVVNTGAVDLLAPTVTAISVTPGTLTTPGTLAVTVSISDDLSGIRDAQLYFYDPLNVNYGPLFTVLDASNRISGDAVSATHLVHVALPPGLAAGTWTIGVFLRDKVGRTSSYGPGGTAYPGPGDGKFTVSAVPLSTFKAFAATHHLTGNDALPGADPDHDGRSNAVELMLGSNPTLADAGSGVFTLSQDATHLHLDFTCAPALTVTANGNHLELRDGGGGAPLWLTGQTQFGLTGPWTAVLPTHIAGNTWRISLALAVGRGFARLTFDDP
ncbi:MAG: Ig-like domain repeat protein [Verrucomicrobia bacterium]|nr:Ig-like domain repeat protein [Verrucomicrobiota bacterium]